MANTRNAILTPQDIEDWKRRINPETGRPYTQSDIAKMHGVSRSYISWIKHNKADSYTQTPREEAMEHYPWDIGVKFHDAAPNKRMRDHAEFISTGGEDMSEDKLQRLEWFYRFLADENVVLEFDPNLPPTKRVKTGGFAFRPRLDSDGDLIIRVNEHTKLTEQGCILWRFPPESPSVRLEHIRRSKDCHSSEGD